MTSPSDPTPDTDRDVEIGRAVARFRTNSGMTQAELAAKMRERGWKWVQPTAWSAEQGKRPLRLAEAVDLAAILSVPLDALLQDPLSRTIGELQVSRADAERRAREATEEETHLSARVRRLTDLKSAHNGQVISWGAAPGLCVMKAFDPDDWDQTAEILLFLGASDRDVSEIRELSLDTDAARPWFDAVNAIWKLLQVLLPTLHSDPE